MKFVFTILLLGFAFSAYGHGDEDHGAAPPIMSQAVAPRAVATVKILKWSRFSIERD
jgi:hypothetical protein